MIQAAAGEIGAVGIQADVSREADVQRLVRETVTGLGGLDAVVNNAAYGYYAERVTRTAEFAAAFGRALKSDSGAVIELVVDPEGVTPRHTLAGLRAAAEAKG